MTDRPLIDWGWIAGHLDDIAARTVQHVELAVLSVAVGFAIAFVLAVWSARRPRIYGPIIAASGIVYTIPSLAAFAALLPITGLSMLTALIPLTAYTLLVLVRNTVAGLTSVPPEVAEAASGMGYTSAQRLLGVDVPLALPLIIAGLRLASVSTIGLVTIASTIGERFGGLGVFITVGLQQFFWTEVYVGAVLSIVLAIVVDVGFVLLLRALTPWRQTTASMAGA